MLPAFLTTLCFAMSGVLAHRSVKLLGSNRANLGRLLMAALVLAVIAHGWGGGLSGPTVGWFFISGVIGFGLGDWGLFRALPILGTRLSLLMTQCLAAPMAIAAEWLWLGTTLSIAQLGSVFVILAGIALALAPKREEAPIPAARARLIVGLLWGLVAAAGQAGGAVISRHAYALIEVAGTSVDGLTATYQRVLGGLLFTLLLLAFMRWHHGRRPEIGIPTALAGAAGKAAGRNAPRMSSAAEEVALAANSRPLTANAAAWVIANAVAGPVIGVSCFQWALETTPSGIVLPIVALTPLVVIPFALRFEGDRPSPRALAGGILAVAGAAALAWSLA